MCVLCVLFYDHDDASNKTNNEITLLRSQVLLTAILNCIYGLNLPLDLQSLAHWSPAISLWHLAPSRTHEVSALFHCSSAFSPPSQLNIWISVSTPRVWNSLCVRISVTSTFRHFIFSQPTPPFQLPNLPSLEYLRPCALILLRPWRYISHVLTY